MRKKLILDTKCKRGITLVSLVVTIIVLLILAGITINLTIGEDGIIKRAQEAGKNYIDAAENEKVQLGQFTNEMNNIIGGSTNNGRTPYNSEFRKNVVEAIKNAGVATTESDTDETIIVNIGKILKEKTKDATATADDIAEGKTAWVNGELIIGNGSDNATHAYQLSISNPCDFQLEQGHYYYIYHKSPYGDDYVSGDGIELLGTTQTLSDDKYTYTMSFVYATKTTSAYFNNIKAFNRPDTFTLITAYDIY